MRHWGGHLARTHAPQRSFWVRSEWEKVDLSYGLATPFDIHRLGWEKAWHQGDTGDLGQCEVKVCYTHLHEGKIKTLAGQLEERRARDRNRRGPGSNCLRYHGLVWLFQHGGIDRLHDIGAGLEAAAQQSGLTVRRGFGYPSGPDDLGRIWPSSNDRDHRCGLSLALVELAEPGADGR